MNQTPRVRRAVTIVLVVIIMLIVVASAGGYYMYSAGITTRETTTQGTNPITVTASTRISTSLGSSTSYAGSFTYVTPLGPYGDNYSSGKPVVWNPTQAAHGTLTLF